MRVCMGWKPILQVEFCNEEGVVTWFGCQEKSTGFYLTFSDGQSRISAKISI
jgi:hypothetical protein